MNAIADFCRDNDMEGIPQKPSCLKNVIIEKMVHLQMKQSKKQL